MPFILAIITSTGATSGGFPPYTNRLLAIRAASVAEWALVLFPPPSNSPVFISLGGSKNGPHNFQPQGVVSNRDDG